MFRIDCDLLWFVGVRLDLFGWVGSFRVIAIGGDLLDLLISVRLFGGISDLLGLIRRGYNWFGFVALVSD